MLMGCWRLPPCCLCTSESFVIPKLIIGYGLWELFPHRNISSCFWLSHLLAKGPWRIVPVAIWSQSSNINWIVFSVLETFSFKAVTSFLLQRYVHTFIVQGWAPLLPIAQVLEQVCAGHFPTCYSPCLSPPFRVTPLPYHSLPYVAAINTH